MLGVSGRRAGGCPGGVHSAAVVAPSLHEGGRRFESGWAPHRGGEPVAQWSSRLHAMEEDAGSNPARASPLKRSDVDVSDSVATSRPGTTCLSMTPTGCVWSTPPGRWCATGRRCRRRERERADTCADGEVLAATAMGSRKRVVDAPVEAATAAGDLRRSRRCYVCKARYTRVGGLYHLLCPACASRWRRSSQGPHGSDGAARAHHRRTREDRPRAQQRPT